MLYIIGFFMVGPTSRYQFFSLLCNKSYQLLMARNSNLFLSLIFLCVSLTQPGNSSVVVFGGLSSGCIQVTSGAELILKFDWDVGITACKNVGASFPLCVVS